MQHVDIIWYNHMISIDIICKSPVSHKRWLAVDDEMWWMGWWLVRVFFPPRFRGDAFQGSAMTHHEATGMCTETASIITIVQRVNQHIWAAFKNTLDQFIREWTYEISAITVNRWSQKQFYRLTSWSSVFEHCSYYIYIERERDVIEI
jgi:hypothetical protein